MFSVIYSACITIGSHFQKTTPLIIIIRRRKLYAFCIITLESVTYNGAVLKPPLEDLPLPLNVGA